MLLSESCVIDTLYLKYVEQPIGLCGTRLPHPRRTFRACVISEISMSEQVIGGNAEDARRQGLIEKEVGLRGVVDRVVHRVGIQQVLAEEGDIPTVELEADSRGQHVCGRIGARIARVV